MDPVRAIIECMDTLPGRLGATLVMDEHAHNFEDCVRTGVYHRARSIAGEETTDY